MSVRVGDRSGETIEVVRDIWFDRDIDGRWLVWVQNNDTGRGDGSDDCPTGAIVVKNQDAISFIQQLGKLIVDPSAFEHEPVFVGADDTTADPSP